MNDTTNTTVVVPIATKIAKMANRLTDLRDTLSGVTYGDNQVTTEGWQRDRDVMNRGRLLQAIDEAEGALTRLLIVGSVYVHCAACEAALDTNRDDDGKA